ncbi:GNAT family N-acetyltransferase [Roseomonas chloroacetimidivorans]|uniref:GNAT family N-acetyltransferase n=1 Tax=Roseomonas chloroacetimidivorans TaxID=1766656 RepID=UPI003C74AF36
MSLQVVDRREGFLALRQDWNALADGLGSPLLRHELFEAMIEAQAGRRSLAIFVLRNGGGAVRGIAPLQTKRRFGARRLEFISHGLHEPNGFLYADEAALEELVRHVFAARLPVLLNRLVEGGTEMACIEGLARGSRRFRYTDGGTILRVPLDPDFAVVEKGISGDRRSSLRRLRKRADGFGKVEFLAVVPGPSDVDGYLDEVFRLEGSGWKGRVGSAILTDPEKGRFFRLYGRAAAERGMLRLFFMRLGGEAIAARFAIAHAGRLWDLKIGYDERWRSCSPGILLTQETLRHACREGLVAHEFLGMAADWERIWRCEERRCRTLRYYPVSAVSLVRLGGEALDLAGRRLGRILGSVRAKGKAVGGHSPQEPGRIQPA